MLKSREHDKFSLHNLTIFLEIDDKGGEKKMMLKKKEDDVEKRGRE